MKLFYLSVVVKGENEDILFLELQRYQVQIPRSQHSGTPIFFQSIITILITIIRSMLLLTTSSASICRKGSGVLACHSLRTEWEQDWKNWSANSIVGKDLSLLYRSHHETIRITDFSSPS